MAVVDKQKVDLLYKKLFGVAKTDFNTLKGASNEVIPSPALIRGDTVWTQSNLIPVPAATYTDVVEYITVECEPDLTTTPISDVYPSWIAKSGSPAERLTNWISPEFHSDYLIEVYIGDPDNNGTRIFDAGINDKGAYYFDYMSGVLNFTNYTDTGGSGNVIPDGLTDSDTIWVRGYRYIGFVGISDQQQGRFGNLQLIDNTLTAVNVDENENPDTGDVILKPRLDGFVRFQGSRLTQHASDATTGYDSNQEFNAIYEKTSLLARASTLNGEELEVTLDGLSPSSTNRFFLAANHTYKVNVNVTARLDGGTESAIWNIDFLASRGALASTTQIIGNTITEKVAGSASTAVTIVTVAATALIGGRVYKIKTLGTGTNWNIISTDPNRDYEVGSVFTATGAGTGTGTAEEYLSPADQRTYSWAVSAEADTTNGLIKILVKGPTKLSVSDPDKTIKWLAAINTLDIFET
jgi:hypothetical protein